jgi:hypothetical protein
MENKFADHNEFDKFAREHDEWNYDNGMGHKGELFSSYRLERFGKIESGKLVDYLVMLREDKEPNKGYILHGIHAKLHEIWAGFINTRDDYQKMMLVVNKFIKEYKNN